MGLPCKILIIALSYLYTSICVNNTISEDTLINGDVNDFSFVVSLQQAGQGHVCAGFLMTPLWVGTSGHCILSSYTDGLFVLAGTLDLKQKNNTFQKRDIEKFYRHSEFNFSLLYNDIGLVKVRKPFKYNDALGFAVFPLYYEQMEPAKKCMALGWTEIGQRTSHSMLHIAAVEYVSMKKCLRFYKHITKNHLCFSSYAGNDTCKGDSGGPIVCHLPNDPGFVFDHKAALHWSKLGWHRSHQGIYRVVGIHSGDSGVCGLKNVPSIHTRLSAHSKWILGVINSAKRRVVIPILITPTIFVLTLS